MPENHNVPLLGAKAFEGRRRGRTGDNVYQENRNTIEEKTLSLPKCRRKRRGTNGHPRKGKKIASRTQPPKTYQREKESGVREKKIESWELRMGGKVKIGNQPPRTLIIIEI